MTTKFFWATCTCVTSFSSLDMSPRRPLEGHKLTEFEQKCEYHRLMDDGDAFAELRSSHLSMAVTIKAARTAVFGDACNPIKHRGAVYDFLCSFENEDKKRAVVLNPLFLPEGKDAQIVAEATRLGVGHDVRVGKLKPTGKVPLIYSCPATATPTATFAALVGGGASNATETRAQITLSIAGTLTKYGLNNTADGTVSHTARTRKNGSNGNLLVTQTAAADGFDEDAANSDVFAAGDEAGHGFTDSGTDPQYSYIRSVFEAASGHATFYFGSRAAGSVCDQTANRYLPFAGCLPTDGTATEANEQVTCRAAGTASHFQVGASANAGVSTRTFRFRKNAGDGNQLVSFLAGATGIAIDSSNTDAIAADDKINSHIQPLLSSDDITIFSNGCVFTSSTGKTDMFCHGNVAGGGQTRTASATEHFFGLGGSMGALTETNSANRQVRMGYTGRFSDPHIYFSSAYAGDATVRLRNDTTGQEISIAVPAGTGLFTNYGTTLDFGPNDDIFCGIVGGTSGIAVITDFGVAVEEVNDPVPGSARKLAIAMAVVASLCQPAFEFPQSSPKYVPEALVVAAEQVPFNRVPASVYASPQATEYQQPRTLVIPETAAAPAEFVPPRRAQPHTYDVSYEFQQQRRFVIPPFDFVPFTRVPSVVYNVAQVEFQQPRQLLVQEFVAPPTADTAPFRRMPEVVYSAHLWQKSLYLFQDISAPIAPEASPHKNHQFEAIYPAHIPPFIMPQRTRFVTQPFIPPPVNDPPFSSRKHDLWQWFIEPLVPLQRQRFVIQEGSAVVDDPPFDSRRLAQLQDRVHFIPPPHRVEVKYNVLQPFIPDDPIPFDRRWIQSVLQAYAELPNYVPYQYKKMPPVLSVSPAPIRVIYLPDAVISPAKRYWFYVMDTRGMRIQVKPGSGDYIRYLEDVCPPEGYIESEQLGASIYIGCNKTGEHNVMVSLGTWTLST